MIIRGHPNYDGQILSPEEFEYREKIWLVITKELVSEDVDYLSFAEQVERGVIAKERPSESVVCRYLKQNCIE